MKAFRKILAGFAAGAILLLSTVSCSSSSTFADAIFKKTQLETTVGRNSIVPLSDAAKVMPDLVVTSDDEDVVEIVKKSSSYRFNAKSTGYATITGTTSGVSADLEVAVGVNVKIGNAESEKYFVDQTVTIPADDSNGIYIAFIGSREVTISKSSGWTVENGITESEIVFEPYIVSATDEFTVTFYNGSSVVSTQSVLANGTVTKPADPSGTGTFVGWYEKNGSNYASSAFDFNAGINRNITLYARFETEEIKVSSITISGESTAALNGTSSYTAIVLPSNALDKTVTWSVTNGTGSATISNTGVLSATAAGTVTVKATANDGSNVSAIKTVEITDATVLSSIELSLSASSVKVGSNVSVTGVTAKYSDGTSKNVTSSATISCDDSYVSISGTTIKGVAKGTATIEASYTEGGITKTASKSLTVNSTTPTVVDDFDGIKILVAKSLGYNKIHYFDASNNSKYSNTTWPGVEITETEGDDYVVKFEGTSSIGFLITKGSGDKLCSSDMIIKEKGTYRVTASGAAKEEAPAEPTEPTVTISPASGNVYLTSTITVTVKDNNATLTTSSATINGKNASLNGAGNTTFKVSDYVTSVGTTFTVTATASNEVGTGSANQTYKVVEKPAFDGPTDWNELRIYQVMVSSFQDGDPSIGYTNAYGPSNAIRGGDLQGIINALDYIKDLGCNALWMTPIFNSDGNDALDSTGYFAKDYFNIDPRFGTMEKFDELVTKCHDNGMAVILDGVFGHNKGTVTASPTRNGILNPGITPSTSNPVDYSGNSNSLKYYSDVARYWITEHKIDGWRFDQCYQLGFGENATGSDNCKTNGHNYWYDIRKVIEEAAASNGTKGAAWGTLGYMVGEHWRGDASLIQKGSVSPSHTINSSNASRGYGLPGCFDFPAYYQLVQNFAMEHNGKSGSNITTGLSYLYKTYSEKGYECKEDDGSYETYYPNVMLSNHDLFRIGDLIQERYSDGYDSDNYAKRNMVVLAAQGAYSGPITIYYGDEIGDHSADTTGWYADNVARSSGKISGFNTREQKIHDFEQKVLKARSEHPALWSGSNTQITGESDFYVAKKQGSGETIYVAFNYNSSSSKTFSASGTDLITGQSYSGTVTVPALSAVYVLAK